MRKLIVILTVLSIQSKTSSITQKAETAFELHQNYDITNSKSVLSGILQQYKSN